jgi:hypothetical protein
MEWRCALSLDLKSPKSAAMTLRAQSPLKTELEGSGALPQIGQHLIECWLLTKSPDYGGAHNF